MTDSRRETIMIVAAAALVAAVWWGDATLTRPEIDHPVAMSDLVTIGVFLQKIDNPQLYPTDYLFASEEAVRQYTPSYRWILSGLVRMTGDVGDALVLLVPMLAFVYIVTMTLFLRRFTSSLFLAILLAAVSSVPHYAPGNEFWGIGGLPFPLARTVFASIAPLLLLVHVRYASSARGAAISLGLAGLATNLHPPSGAVLAQMLLAERTIAVLKGRFALKGVVISAACFVLGALPVMVNVFSVAGSMPATKLLVGPAAFYAAIAARFPQQLLPPSLDDCWYFAEAFLPLLPLAFLGARSLRVQPEQKEELAGTLRLLGTLILVVIGGQIVLQELARNVGWSFMVIDQLRGLRMVYPLAFALAAAGLDGIRGRMPRGLWVAAALAFAVLLLPVISLPSCELTMAHFPAPVTIAGLSLSGQQDRVRQELGAPSVEPQTHAMEAAAHWAWKNSPPRALFLCYDGRFRLFSHRSIAFAYKDGGNCYYLGKPMFLEWVRRAIAMGRAYKSRNVEGWISVAKELGCNYAVVDKTALDRQRVAEAAYQNDFFAVVPVEARTR
jgi:hypothetical protein